MVPLAAMALAACGPDRREIRQDVVEQRPAKAEQAVNELYGHHLAEFGADRPDTGVDRHILLWRMERGTIDALQGEWGNALRHFRAAYRLSRDLRTASVGRATAALIVNDNLERYRGEPFEHPFIAYYGMLAHLAIAQRLDGTWSAPPPTPSGKSSAVPEEPPTIDAETAYDRAAAGAAAIENLQRETADQEHGRSDYRENPFLHLAAAAARAAAARNGDDRSAAVLAAERAWRAYAAVGAVPRAAQVLLPRLIAAADPERLAAIPGAGLVPLPADHGMLLAIEELGFVPKREALQVYAVTGVAPPGAIDLGGVFLYVKDPRQQAQLAQMHAFPLPGELLRQITGGRLGVFGLELPVLPEPRQRPAPGAWAVGERMLQDSVVDDVTAHARTCFDDHRVRTYITIITRTVVKLVGTRQAIGAAVPVERDRNGQPKNVGAELLRDVLWGITSFGVTASEQADTRCWTLLPDRIAATVIDLPAGTHPLALRRADGVSVPLGTVRIRPGGLAIVTARSFPAGTDLGAED